MASRMKVSTVLKMAVVCVLFVGAAALGVAASSEVIHAALGDPKNQNDYDDGSRSGHRDISYMGGGSRGGVKGGRQKTAMPEMMMQFDAAPEMEMATASAVPSPRSFAKMSKSAAGGSAGGFNGLRNNDPEIEKLIRQEGGYDAQMGQDVMDTKRKSQFDPMKVQPMLVRTGNIQATTDSNEFDTLQDKLIATVLAVPGAYVESSNNYGGWKDQHDKIQGRSINIQARVPVDMFFKLRDSIVQVFAKGEVGSMSDSVSDVTSQYIDAAARAETLKSTQTQLQKLMTYAQTVDAVIKVQRELTSVTQQLEAKEAIMQSLSKQSSLSSLSINVNQKQPPPDQPDKPKKKHWSVFRTLKRAQKWLRVKVQNTIDVLIFTCFASVPTAVLYYLVVCLMRVTNTTRFVTMFTNWISNTVYSFFSSCFSGSGSGSGCPDSSISSSGTSEYQSPK